MSEYSNKEIELIPGVLRGYRSWFLRDNKLMSIGGYPINIWSIGENLAHCHSRYYRSTSNFYERCLYHDTLAPELACKCGLYGLYMPPIIPTTRIPVFGVIEAYGRIILGTSGFRAEKARVVALAPNFTWIRDGTKLVSECFNVPFYESLDELTEDFPTDLEQINNLISNEFSVS